VTDLAIVVLVASIAIALGVHDPAASWGIGPAMQISLIAAVLVLAGLTVVRAWDRGMLGQGSEEFNRIVRGAALASIALALAGMALKIDAVRPWIFGVIPATAAGLLLGRCGVRRVLHRARRGARCMSAVLVVGSEAATADLVARIGLGDHTSRTHARWLGDTRGSELS
jgi:FlaA1/EpsC-like NDP-sugar epimerase